MKNTLIVLCLLVLTGCQTTSGAGIQGRANAGITLPPWPDECRIQEIHAALRKNEDIRAILKRERAALNRANERVTVCAEYYDQLRELYGVKDD